MTNAFRVRILTEIDQHGTAYGTAVDLELNFRHANHWANWAALWNLEAHPFAAGVIRFTRRTAGNAVREDPRLTHIDTQKAP